MAVKIGKGLAIAVKSLAESIKFVKEIVDIFALALGALIALKVAGFFYAIATALASLTVGMKAFNFATKKNIIFGSMVVFAGAMGFLIKKFQEFKGELDIATMSMEELNKEIERVERAMRRGLNIKNLTAELAIYKKRLNDLKEEGKVSAEEYPISPDPIKLPEYPQYPTREEILEMATFIREFTADKGEEE